MLRKIITLLSIGLIAGASAEKSDKMDQIQKSIEKITAKAGISIDGEVKSQYLSSTINGNGANDMERKAESNEFTSVDFDIKARPNEMISGRVIFRMHQNWQNFFSDVANPIFTRWISIDGNVKDMFYFHAGDFKDQYSPLTLYSPDLEIMNEPYIFARQREIAMSDVFVGNNDRALQGLNLKFEAEIAPLFDEFRLSLIGSRLRNVDVAVSNGQQVTQLIQASRMAKYFVGGNLDLTLLKGINLGGTYLYIFDQKNSYRINKDVRSDTRDSAEVLAQSTSILSLRPGVDITKIIGVDAISFKLNTEFAFSNDDSTRFGPDYKKDTTMDLISEKINGSAINLGGQLGISPSDMWGIKVNGSFIMNSKDYRNDLAQSPSFLGDRIMNTENKGVNDTLYNTFDALYHNVFKFTPSKKQEANRWAKAPYMKNNYSRSILTQDEMAALMDVYDPALQLVMPFGPATANRVGINANVNVSLLKNGIVADVIYANLKEKEEYIGGILWKNEIDNKSFKIDSAIVYPKAEFSQLGAGLKFDFSKMIPAIKYPFELSGSYMLSTLNIPEVDSVSENSIKSGFINLGLYYRFYKRAALLGGYQIINNTYSELKVGEQKGVEEAEIKLGNWAFGLEWKVSDGASVVATYGRMSRDNPEIEIETQVNGEVHKKIIDTDTHQSIVDVSLRILF